MLAPLAVWAGLNAPQDPVGVQLQSTPAFAESLATLAATVAVAPAVMVVGGAVASVTDIVPEELLVVLVVLADPTAPQPERQAMSERKTKRTGEIEFARSDTQNDSRVWSTVSSGAAIPQFLRGGAVIRHTYQRGQPSQRQGGAKRRFGQSGEIPDPHGVKHVSRGTGQSKGLHGIASQPSTLRYNMRFGAAHAARRDLHRR